jgi:hypothetical protein
MIIFSSVICLFGGNVAAMESPFDISCQGPWVVSQVAPAKRRLPYVIKKERNGAGEITLGLYPAARR